MTQYISKIQNVQIADISIRESFKEYKNQSNEQFNTIENKKLDKNGILSMANMGQDIKEALINGAQNVAVVGENAVLRDNILNGEVNFRKLNENIQENFNYDYEEYNINFTNGGYWDFSKGTKEISEGNYYSNEIAIRVGDEFKILGASKWRANLYLIKDSDNNILSVFPNTNESLKQHNDIKFTIPNKGSKLCINSIDDYPTRLEKLNKITVNGVKINFAKNSIEKDKLDEGLTTFFEDVYNKDFQPSWISGSYYRLNSLAIVEDSESSRAVINVKEGDKFEITGVSYWEANLYYIADKYDNIIENYPNKSETTTTYTKKVVIPKNGAKLYINQRNTSPTIIKTVSSYKLLTNQLNKKWVAYGDSLTDSKTLNGNKNYVNYVCKSLGLTVANLGVAGSGYINGNSGTQQFYNRTSSIPLDTDVLTVFGSFNDLYIDLPIGTIKDTEPTTLYGAINKFLNNCWNINPSMIIGIISPTPWENWWRGHLDISRVEKCVNYVNVLEAVAKYYSLPYLDLFNSSSLRPWDITFKNKYYLNADGNHPNSLGHEKYITPKVESFIKSIIN